MYRWTGRAVRIRRGPNSPIAVSARATRATVAAVGRDAAGGALVIEAPVLCGRGHITSAAAARMLDRGARVDETGDLRITALWHAANNGDEAMVALLLDRGADARQRPVVVPPLVAAAGANSLPTVIRLLEAGADPNGEGMPSQNAIHTAAAKGNAEMVRVLIDAGANANTRFFDGTTPLLTAALAGHAEVVAALLQIDANIDAQNEREGHTALMVAAWRGHAEVVELLLAAGADRTLVDNEGRTAADLASRANPKLAERIRSYEPRND